MSMSVGFRTIGSEANTETARPSATVNFFKDSRAASGPTPAGLAANNVETASARGARSNDILFIEREAAESTRGFGGEFSFSGGVREWSDTRAGVAPFPATPALSLGERVNRSRRGVQSRPFAFRCAVRAVP